MRLVLLLGFVVAAAACSDSAPAGTPPPVGDRNLAARFALTDDSDFERKAAPRSGEWLDRFDETGESYEDYVRSDPVRPTPARRMLAFVRVGEFGTAEAAAADAALRFASLWFRLPVRELEAQPLPGSRWSREREIPGRNAPVRQVRTTWFLNDLLPEILPEDAVCVMAITTVDLYPDETWNFVFGQSSFRRRVAVSSIARYYGAFRGRRDTPASLALARRRAMAVTVHEIGHAFGLRHCVEYECAMNGSNSLEESDRQPLRLCPPCLAKLAFALGFDPIRRYEDLERFYRESGLGDEADWIANRLDRISRAGR